MFVDRGYGRKRLAFASLHLCNVTALKRKRAQHLHIEHAEPEHTLRNDRGESNRFNNVGISAQLFRSTLQLLVSEPRQFLPPTGDGPQLVLRLTITPSEEAQYIS
jgi:hypothetical protein